jgi:hypothetical protein
MSNRNYKHFEPIIKRDRAIPAKEGRMKIIAGIGLLFFLYCFIQIIAKWQSRDTAEKTIWFIIIAVGGGWCTSVLLR